MDFCSWTPHCAFKAVRSTFGVSRLVMRTLFIAHELLVLGQKGRLALDLMVEKVQYFLLYAVVISVVDCVDCTIILWVSLNMVFFWDLDLIGLSHRFPKPYLRPVWIHLQFIRIELKGSYFSHKVGLYLYLFFYLFTTIHLMQVKGKDIRVYITEFFFHSMEGLWPGIFQMGELEFWNSFLARQFHGLAQWKRLPSLLFAESYGQIPELHPGFLGSLFFWVLFCTL